MRLSRSNEPCLIILFYVALSGIKKMLVPVVLFSSSQVTVVVVDTFKRWNYYMTVSNILTCQVSKGTFASETSSPNP